MIWWLTLAVALLGPVLLLYTGLSMVRRLERLEAAVRRARAGQARAQTMRVALARLQQRLATLAAALPARQPGGGRPAVEPPAAGLPQATAETDGRIRGDRHGSFGRIER